jgi:hypothetical protein
LPWPDLDDVGAVSLLQTVRTAAGPRLSAPAIGVALPVPGDVRGLPAGTQFQRDAVTAGEAVIIGREASTAVGLVPEFDYGELEDETEFDPEPTALSWTAYSVPTEAPTECMDLGEAEYTLRSAVRSAADALGAIRAAGADVADPRGLVEQVLQSARGHRAPDHAPSRAVRVLENAAHIDAIITVSSGLIPIGLQTSSEVQIASDALRPLSAVVRSARMAAVSAILHSAWQG